MKPIVEWRWKSPALPDTGALENGNPCVWKLLPPYAAFFVKGRHESVK